MKNLIAYHAGCADGQCAAFVAWKATDRCAETVAVNYDLHKKPFEETYRQLTKNLICGIDLKEYHLIVVDFSFPYDTMVSLAKVFGEVTVLDHHKTAQDDLDQHIGHRLLKSAAHPYPKYVYPIAPHARVYFCKEESGALMAWRHFFGETAGVPDFVRYTSDRDLWKFLDPKTKPFASGMGLHRTASWVDLEAVYDAPETVIASGTVIEQIRNARIDAVLKNKALELTATVDGLNYRIGCFNAPADITSDLLAKYIHTNGNPAVGMTYTLGSDGTAYCSMRSRAEVDSSVIACAMGGGGHAQANGFVIPQEDMFRILRTKVLAPSNPHGDAPFEWSYRRHGSELMKGYTIFAVNDIGHMQGDPIAYLGDGDLTGAICDTICDAHNEAIGKSTTR